MIRTIATAVAAALLLTASARAGDWRYEPGNNGFVAIVDLFGASDLRGLGSGACAQSTLPLLSQSSTQYGATSGGAVFATVEFQVAGAFTASTNQSLAVWLLRSVDGLNVEMTASCSTTQPPVGRLPDFVIPLLPVALASGNRFQSGIQRLPAGSFQAIIWNSGTGVLSANNHTIKLAAFMVEQ
jgi:hypothetical protein